MNHLSACTLGLLLVSASEAGHGYGGMSGPHPDFALARIDERGIIHIRVVTGFKQEPQPLTVRKLNDKGQPTDVKIIVGRHHIDEQITTIHHGAVKLFGVDGKARDASNLATLLKSERPVLVVHGPPEGKFLSGYRKDLPVLSLPNLPFDSGGGTIEVPVPARPPKEKKDPTPKPST